MILIIGDLHFKESLSFSENVADGRSQEKNDVLNTLIEESKNCSDIVFLGDQFHRKNNTSEVVKEFVSFLEKFGDKKIHLICGNHEKKADGSSALDFIKEIKGKNWYVYSQITKGVMIGKIKADILPYMYKHEYGLDSIDQLSGVIHETLFKESDPEENGSVLFAHYGVTGGADGSESSIEDFITGEPVLVRSLLKPRYKMVYYGHIHKPKWTGDGIIGTGSVFTNEVGEDTKWAYILNDSTMEEGDISLPVRSIVKVIDPTEKDISLIKPYSIVKCIITKRETDLIKMHELLGKFSGHIIMEDFRSERKKDVSIEAKELDLSINNLIEVYAKQSDVDPNLIRDGYQRLS